MVQQCFNLFICKARLGLPIGGFMFANKYNFIGVFFGALFVMAIVYIPFLNVAFQTSCNLSPLIWTAPILSGIVMFVYAVIRTIIIRARKLFFYNYDFYRKPY